MPCAWLTETAQWLGNSTDNSARVIVAFLNGTRDATPAKVQDLNINKSLRHCLVQPRVLLSFLLCISSLNITYRP